MKFSLIIPCFNESRCLPSLLEKCKPIALIEDYEVIFVDNGSTDETPNLLKQLLPSYSGCRSLRVEKNLGYGEGILCGLKAARGEILGWTHADLQTNPRDVLIGLELFTQKWPNSNNILAKGRRYGRPLKDVLFTIGMSLFETVLLKRLFWDINAQPNLFSREFFETWKADAPKDFALDLFVYFIAQKNGLAIKRFPVKFTERPFGISHWNIDWKSKMKFIIRTIQFSLELKKRL